MTKYTKMKIWKIREHSFMAIINIFCQMLSFINNSSNNKRLLKTIVIKAQGPRSLSKMFHREDNACHYQFLPVTKPAY